MIKHKQKRAINLSSHVFFGTQIEPNLLFRFHFKCFAFVKLLKTEDSTDEVMKIASKSPVKTASTHPYT